MTELAAARLAVGVARAEREVAWRAAPRRVG